MNSLEWVLHTLQCQLDAPPLHSFPLSKFVVDSREVEKNSLFFALPGERTEGRVFLEEAAKKGATFGVVPSRYQGPHFGLHLLFVDDPLQALHRLARKKMESMTNRSVGITGSLGKTSTKQWCASFLQRRYEIFQTPGNANSQIGLPLSILNGGDPKQTHSVFEMGMDRKGQIAKLVEIVEPEIGVLTALDYVHSCNFSSLEEIALAKGEIFSGKNLRLALIAKEIPFFEEILALTKGRGLSYSVCDPSASYFLDCRGDTQALFCRGTKKWTLPKPKVCYPHELEHLLAGLVVSVEYGVSHKDVVDQIRSYQPLAGRGKSVQKKGILFIDDAYNASLQSTLAALQALRGQPEKGKKIAVLGEIKELGKHSHSVHSELARCAVYSADSVLLYGDAYLPFASKNAFHFEEKKELLAHLQTHASKGDVVLLKGSNCNALSLLIEEF